MRLALVTSPNGLGHARRQLQLSIGLSSFCSVTLFGNARILKMIEAEALSLELENIGFQEIPGIGLDQFLMRDTGSEQTPKLSREALISLESADAVLSDNSIWPASMAEKVFLLGHFLWTDYFRAVGLGYNSDFLSTALEEEESLIPNIVAWFNTNRFTWIQGTNHPKKIEIPLLKYKQDKKGVGKLGHNNEIWIAKGTTGLVKTEKIQSLPGLQIETHNFSRRDHPRLVLGRPGLGTIRDCLSHGVPFLPICMNENPELENNAYVYKSLMRNHGVASELLEFTDQNEVLEKDFGPVREASLEIWDQISDTPHQTSGKLLSEIADRL